MAQANRGIWRLAAAALIAAWAGGFLFSTEINAVGNGRPRFDEATVVLISEVQIAGAVATDEFVELYNPTHTPVSLAGWRLSRKTAAGNLSNLLTTFPNVTIPPHGFLLIAHAEYDGLAAADVIYSTANSLAADNTVILYSDAGFTVVDKVGFGGVADFEGVPFPSNPSPNGSIERKPGEAEPAGGNGQDTQNNAADFALRSVSDPQNLTSIVEPSIQSPTSTPTASSTETPSPTSTLDLTSTATPTDTATPPPTLTPTATPSATASPTSTASPTASALPPLFIVINEVAWSGTSASSSDEWIELHNPNPFAVNLAGLILTSPSDGSPAISLSGTIAAGGFFLLERTDDSSVSDTAADQLYTGDLGNGGETLLLKDAGGAIIDSANGNGGAWPAGAASPLFRSMERIDPRAPDSDSNWASNDGVHRNGLDAFGGAINGSPRSANSAALPTSTPTLTLTPTPTETASPTPTATVTPTASPTPAATAVLPRSVVLNEVAWAGTRADANDEWIELLNTLSVPLDVTGYTVDDGGDLHVALSGAIPAGGFYLLERTDDTATDVLADQTYSGGLRNEGEQLTLRDPAGNVIDTANGDGGAWPAGSNETFASMERLSVGADADSNWVSNFGHVTNGLDKSGNPIRGTPKSANSATVPTLVPTALPGGVVLNEFLPNPDSDWDNSGVSSNEDEFIELMNLNPFPVDLTDYMLDDDSGGSQLYRLSPGTVLGSGETQAFFRSQTGVSLNDSGDAVRLLGPAGQVLDSVAYGRNPGNDTSWSRLPDGSGDWHADGVPSPGRGNGRRVPPPPPPAVSVAQFRDWPDGAWVTVRGRVSVPPSVFGARQIVLQDETGGVYIYLGSGSWPDLKLGQRVDAFGYLRTRTGQRELYVRNLFQVGLGEELAPPSPVPVRTGAIGDALEGTLVVVEGRVVRLESNAFWLDDGSGRARVFFSASTGVERPKVRRGEVWRAVGVAGELTTASSKVPGYRLRIRFEFDLMQLTDRRGQPLMPQSTSEPEPTEEPASPP